MTWAIQHWKYYLPSNITLVQVLPLAEWIIMFYSTSFNCQGSEMVLYNVTPGRFASDVRRRACESLGINGVTEPLSGLAPQKDFKTFDPCCCENVWFEDSFPSGCPLKVWKSHLNCVNAITFLKNFLQTGRKLFLFWICCFLFIKFASSPLRGQLS